MLRGPSTLYPGPAEEVYDDWDPPDLIVSDGAYGVGGFPGDPRTPDGLEAWYADHVIAWAKHSHPATTLWFWNTEIGWATVHPLLASEGWEYVQTILWDKGIGHIAGNVNGDTIWEPFGGLCTASVAAVETGRNAFAAEPDSYFSSLAKQRLAGRFAGDQLPLRM